MPGKGTHGLIRAVQASAPRAHGRASSKNRRCQMFIGLTCLQNEGVHFSGLASGSHAESRFHCLPQPGLYIVVFRVWRFDGEIETPLGQG